MLDSIYSCIARKYFWLKLVEKVTIDYGRGAGGFVLGVTPACPNLTLDKVGGVGILDNRVTAAAAGSPVSSPVLSLVGLSLLKHLVGCISLAAVLPLSRVFEEPTAAVAAALLSATMRNRFPARCDTTGRTAQEPVAVVGAAKLVSRGTCMSVGGGVA